MDAPLKRTIFDIKNNNLVFKLIIFGKIKSTKETIKLFTDSVKKHSDAVTGLLLVYSSYTLCLIESSETIVYEIGSNILSNDNYSKNLEVCRCFPIHFSDAGRFFPRWYFKEINLKLSDNFEDLDIKDIYNNVISNLYRFYWELKTSDFLEGKLDVLAKEASDRLPSVETLELLISNPWGYDLKSILDSYYNNLEPEEDEIWPIQKIQSPSIYIRHN